MNDIFKIGVIVRPHGIRGEMKVNSFTDGARFKNLKSVIVDGKTYRLSGVREVPPAVYLTFFGITDRTAAESLRGKIICVKREDQAPLEESTFYVADLIGSSIVSEDGETLCVLKEVISAKTDVFSCETKDGKTVMFPFLKDLLINVDTERKIITVSKKRFGEICVYED